MFPAREALSRLPRVVITARRLTQHSLKIPFHTGVNKCGKCGAKRSPAHGCWRRRWKAKMWGKREFLNINFSVAIKYPKRSRGWGTFYKKSHRHPHTHTHSLKKAENEWKTVTNPHEAADSKSVQLDFVLVVVVWPTYFVYFLVFFSIFLNS